MDWEKMKNELDKDQKNRDREYDISRMVVVLSKKVILLVNNESPREEIDDKIKEMEELLKKTTKEIAFQEYVEAKLYYKYIYDNVLEDYDGLDVDYVSYLKGLFDFVGELVRRAVSSSIKGRNEEAIAIYEFVNDIYDRLSTFDFRSSDLRRGYDSMRWNLRKLEDMAFTLKASDKVVK